jgi:hypothetical protein
MALSASVELSNRRPGADMNQIQHETAFDAHSALVAPPSRRSSRRYDVRLEVELTLGDQVYQVSTRTLSLGGAFIDSDLHPPFDTRLTLRFVVPYHHSPVEVGGVVRWSDARGFGVQFDGLRAHSVWALGKFFEQQ